MKQLADGSLSAWFRPVATAPRNHIASGTLMAGSRPIGKARPAARMAVTAYSSRTALAQALGRPFAFAALDGPGQRAALYDQRVPMRPDWENVVPPMFDAVTADQKVDPGRVVLVGRSFGGLIAPREAAGERRLAAMIVDPGQYDLGTAVTARLGPLMDQVNDPAADPQFDALLDIPAVKALLGPGWRPTE